MKKLIISLLAVSLLLLPQAYISASNNASVNQDTNYSKPRIEEILQTQMTYPKIAVEERIEGDVNVVFRINEKGEIVIAMVNSEEAILENYVKQSLQNVLLPDYCASRETYKINFKFNLM